MPTLSAGPAARAAITQALRLRWRLRTVLSHLRLTLVRHVLPRHAPPRHLPPPAHFPAIRQALAGAGAIAVFFAAQLIVQRIGA
jgi:hypothetical protein